MRDAAFDLWPDPRMDTYGDSPPCVLSPENIQRLALQLLPLVNKIAYSLIGHLPSHINVDDLISAGKIGLMEALDKYDPSRGIPPSTFCGYRIKGAMLDYLRSTDVVSRETRDLVEKIAEITRVTETELGHGPSNGELATGLGVHLDVLERWVAKGKLAPPPSIFSIEDVSGAAVSQEADQFEHTLQAEMQEILAEAIRDVHLDERRKLAFELYYFGGSNLREIGEILEITETRVCQILRDVRRELRNALEGLSLDDLC